MALLFSFFSKQFLKILEFIYICYMNVSEIQLFNILRAEFGDDKAGKLVDFVQSKVKAELEQNTATFLTQKDKTELVSLIKDTRADIIKWMFIFWVGQIGVLLGVLALFFK